MGASMKKEFIHFLQRLFRRTPRISLFEYTNLLINETTLFPHFVVSWHHDVMIKELQDWVEGKTPFLIILAPPRHGKSALCSEILPSYIHYYYLHEKKEVCLMCPRWDIGPHFTRLVQRAVSSEPWEMLADHRRWMFKKPVRLIDRNKVGHLMSDLSSFYAMSPKIRREAVKVDFLISDEIGMMDLGKEPMDYGINVEHAIHHSKQILHCTSKRGFGDMIYKAQLSSFHQWKKLILPAIAEEDETWTGASGRVYKREKGQALWHQHFDKGLLTKIERDIGKREFNYQFQQHPYSD